MSVAILNRLRAMDRAELTFRASAALRNSVGRARSVLATPTWRRETLRLSQLPELGPAHEALATGDWRAAHRTLAAHFLSREPRYPLDPRRLPQLVEQIRTLFPQNEAIARAERITAGFYDLLGYRSVRAGAAPDWHTDPVHGRRAPLVFWDSVPYLDPACGDHKVTWELNRHQHFLVLGRAFALSGDTRFYRTFRVQLLDWMRTNPPLMGTNWASMLELAFRSLSWLWAMHVFAAAVSEEDAEPWLVDLLLALDRQLEHVEQNLSRYFSPNTHLTGEALGLYVAGRALPELASSARRAGIGREVLLTEAHRQVLPDGGHAELSAHYHRYSTDFYLLALATARISGDPAEPAFREAAHRQARVLRALADDTGRLPLIGDDDGGQLFPICGRTPADAADTLATAAVLLDDPALRVAATPEETFWFCGTTPHVADQGAVQRAGSVALEHTGYCISRDGTGNHLIFDCGRHGFLNGGHAHADALSVVVTAGNRPLLVDPGTATYTMDPAARDRFRSTAMHNTLVIGDRSQSEPRGPFHWATRTDAQRLVWRPGAPFDHMEGRHLGYAPVTHTRCVLAVHGLGWMVIDHLTGAAADVKAAAMWHVHPQWQMTQRDARHLALTATDGAEAAILSSAPLARAAAAELHEYAPEYGRIEEALCLSARVEGSLPLSIGTFIAAGPAGRGHVTPVSLDVPPEGGWLGTAFRVETDSSCFVALSALPPQGVSDGASPPETWGLNGSMTSLRADVLFEGPELASSMHEAGRS